jgi:hypothetical protein
LMVEFSAITVFRLHEVRSEMYVRALASAA